MPPARYLVFPAFLIVMHPRRETRGESCTSSPVSIHRCGYLIKHLPRRPDPLNVGGCDPFQARRVARREATGMKAISSAESDLALSPAPSPSPALIAVRAGATPITSDRDTTLTFPAICRDLLPGVRSAPSRARFHPAKQYAADRERTPLSPPRGLLSSRIRVLWESTTPP